MQRYFSPKIFITCHFANFKVRDILLLGWFGPTAVFWGAGGYCRIQNLSLKNSVVKIKYYLVQFGGYYQALGTVLPFPQF